VVWGQMTDLSQAQDDPHLVRRNEDFNVRNKSRQPSTKKLIVHSAVGPIYLAILLSSLRFDRIHNIFTENSSLRLFLLVLLVILTIYSIFFQLWITVFLGKNWSITLGDGIRLKLRRQFTKCTNYGELR
jgi:hypothetical protein